MSSDSTPCPARGLALTSRRPPVGRPVVHLVERVLGTRLDLPRILQHGHTVFHDEVRQEDRPLAPLEAGTRARPAHRPCPGDLRAVGREGRAEHAPRFLVVGLVVGQLPGLRAVGRHDPEVGVERGPRLRQPVRPTGPDVGVLGREARETRPTGARLHRHGAWWAPATSSPGIPARARSAGTTQMIEVPVARVAPPVRGAVSRRRTGRRPRSTRRGG